MYRLVLSNAFFGAKIFDYVTCEGLLSLAPRAEEITCFEGSFVKFWAEKPFGKKKSVFYILHYSSNRLFSQFRVSFFCALIEINASENFRSKNGLILSDLIQSKMPL